MKREVPQAKAGRRPPNYRSSSMGISEVTRPTPILMNGKSRRSGSA